MKSLRAQYETTPLKRQALPQKEEAFIEMDCISSSSYGFHSIFIASCNIFCFI